MRWETILLNKAHLFSRIWKCYLLVISTSLLGGGLEFDYESQCSAITGVAEIEVFPIDSGLFQVSLDGGATYEPEGVYSFTINIITDSSIELVLRAQDGCESPMELIQFIIPPNPVGTTLQEGCEGDGGLIFVNDPGTPYEIKWYASASGDEEADGDPLTILNGSIFSPSTAGTYYAATIHPESGCESASRFEVSYSFLPEVNYEVFGFECDPLSGFYHYMVVPSGGSGSDYLMSADIPWVDAGDYFLIEDIVAGTSPEFSIQDGNGCSTGSVALASQLCFCADSSIPIPTAAKVEVSFCADEGIPTISVDAPAAGQGVRWYADESAYFPANGVSSGAVSELFQPTEEGVFYAVYYDELNGCASESRLAIEVQELETLQIEMETSECSADLASYSVELFLEGGSGTYQLEAEGYSVNPMGSGVYWIEGIPNGTDLNIQAEDELGCLSEIVTVSGIDCNCSLLTMPNLQSSQQNFGICSNEVIPTLTVEAVGIDYSIIWSLDEAGLSPASGGITGTNGELFTPDSEGVYYAILQHNDSDCLGANALAFEINTYEPITVFETSSTCSSDLSTYEITFDITGGFDNAYVVDAGSFVTTNIGSSYTVAGIPAGESIELSVNDGANCSLLDFSLSMIDCNCNPADLSIPAISVNEQMLLCAGESLYLIVESPAAGYSVEWFQDEGLSIPAEGDLSGIANDSLMITSAGSYFAALRDELSDCIGLASTEIIVADASPLALANYNFDCSADLVNYDFYFELEGGISESSSISCDNGEILEVNNGYLITGLSEGNSGEITIDDSEGCGQTKLSLPLYICDCDPASLPWVEGQRTYSVCAEDGLPLMSLNEIDESYELQWYDAPIEGNLLSSGSNYQADAEGSYWVEVLQPLSGCKSISRTEIKVEFLTPILVEELQQLCHPDGQNYDLQIAVSGSLGAGYQFEADGYTTDKHTEGVYIIRNIPSDFSATLLVGDPVGCQSDLIYFDAHHCELPPPPNGLLMPSAFSPNADGVNDEFSIKGNNLVEAQMKIYNRWGQLVFFGSMTDEPWNGLKAGQPAELGVYTYYVDALYKDGETELVPGSVVLMR